MVWIFLVQQIIIHNYLLYKGIGYLKTLKIEFKIQSRANIVEL